MEQGIDLYNALSRPPKEALKAIEGGRLKGKSSISPQWRYKVMTEKFGLCGFGWRYTIDRVWPEQGADGQVFAWAQVSVQIRDGENWSDPIPGIGGNYLVEKESKGLHSNDEGYKMAVTDALGTALKVIGVASSIYMDEWDGDKYVGGVDYKLQDWIVRLETSTSIEMLKETYEAAKLEYPNDKKNSQALKEIMAVKDEMKARLANATA
jgi:hypothetical protein